MRCAAKRALRNQSWGLICSRLRALQWMMVCETVRHSSKIWNY